MDKKPSYKKLYEEEKKKNEEYLDILKRLQADFENFKKRIEKEKEDFVKYANCALISKLLVILDDFDNALKHADSDKTQILNGLKLLHEKIKKLLYDEGLKEINCKGQTFDPYQHEVLQEEDSEEEDGKILEEFQKGYVYKDKILRSSKVKISKKNKENKNGK